MFSWERVGSELGASWEKLECVGVVGRDKRCQNPNPASHQRDTRYSIRHLKETHRLTIYLELHFPTKGVGSELGEVIKNMKKTSLVKNPMLFDIYDVLEQLITNFGGFSFFDFLCKSRGSTGWSPFKV